MGRDATDVRPALLFEESFAAIIALHEHDGWRAAMRPAGHHRPRQGADRPVADRAASAIAAEDGAPGRALHLLLPRAPERQRLRPPDRGRAGARRPRPAARCSRSSTTASCPIPPEPGSYYPEDIGPLRTDLRPLEITQPDGPSFTVEGNLVRWQKWSLRVSLDPHEGLVLHTVGYDDGGRIRPDPAPGVDQRDGRALRRPRPDARLEERLRRGEWGLGRMANSLTLGCDCLGEIHYFDAVTAERAGRPAPRCRTPSACTRRTTGSSGSTTTCTAAAPRSAARAGSWSSSIATVGNYEYGFYWYLYLDGTIQLEVKLTGIMSTQALAPGDERRRYAPLDRARPGRAACTSTCSAPGSTSTSTAAGNEVHEVDVEAAAAGRRQPVGQRLRRA